MSKVSESFIREYQKAFKESDTLLLKRLSERTLLLQDLIQNFISSEVRPNLNNQLENLDKESPDYSQDVEFISHMLDQLSDYHEGFQIVAEGSNLKIQISMFHRSLYNSLQYGTPRTDTFEHMERIETFIQNSSQEVNKIEGRNDLPIKLRRSSL